MSSISAGTTTGTALVSTGDTTGQLVLKTNGTTTAVTIGTDQTVTLASVGKIKALLETTTVTASAPSSTTNFDALTQAVQYYTSDAANNWTLNIRGDGSTALNSVMATGQSLTIAVITTQGATPYYASALTIDGSAVTPKYQGGTAWAAGNASGLDVYSYTVVKTASATFTVLASQTQFK